MAFVSEGIYGNLSTFISAWFSLGFARAKFIANLLENNNYLEQCNEGDEEDIEKIKKSSASRQQQSSMVAKNALSESHNAWLMSLSPAFAELPRFKALFVAKNKTELCLYV